MKPIFANPLVHPRGYERERVDSLSAHRIDDLLADAKPLAKAGHLFVAQDRVTLKNAKSSFTKVVGDAPLKQAAVKNNGDSFDLSSGAVVIAASLLYGAAAVAARRSVYENG